MNIPRPRANKKTGKVEGEIIIGGNNYRRYIVYDEGKKVFDRSTFRVDEAKMLQKLYKGLLADAKKRPKTTVTAVTTRWNT